MPSTQTPEPVYTGSRLVGQPLLYAISVFASLGVFLVRCFYPSLTSTWLTVPIVWI
jgi:hypothetical protein